MLSEQIRVTVSKLGHRLRLEAYPNEQQLDCYIHVFTKLVPELYIKSIYFEYRAFANQSGDSIKDVVSLNQNAASDHGVFKRSVTRINCRET